VLPSNFSDTFTTHGSFFKHLPKTPIHPWTSVPEKRRLLTPCTCFRRECGLVFIPTVWRVGKVISVSLIQLIKTSDLVNSEVFSGFVLIEVYCLCVISSNLTPLALVKRRWSPVCRLMIPGSSSIGILCLYPGIILQVLYVNVPIICEVGLAIVVCLGGQG